MDQQSELVETAALDGDTIAAIATPPGKGGVAIVRLSGHHAWPITRTLCMRSVEPRTPTLSNFVHQSVVIDQGLVLLFQGPNSFTGEDVAELHCHGGVRHQFDVAQRVSGAWGAHGEARRIFRAGFYE